MTNTPVTDDDKGSKQRRAYGLAQKRLREAHREEFNSYMREEAKTLGIDWSPRPTDEQKAAAELQRLLAAHPGLREQMGLPPEGGPSADYRPDQDDGAQPSE